MFEELRSVGCIIADIGREIELIESRFEGGTTPHELPCLAACTEHPERSLSIGIVHPIDFPARAVPMPGLADHLAA
jgi:hypothetical protein